MSPKAKAKASAVDLSTLVALARVRNKNMLDRQRVLSNLSSSWARNLAEAIIDTDAAQNLSDSDARDLRSVRQLAGVTE